MNVDEFSAKNITLTFIMKVETIYNKFTNVIKKIHYVS